MLVLCRKLIGELSPGAVVDVAESAEQALEMLRVAEYDVLLADHHMPGATGVDLLAWARRERPEMERILMTALPQMDIAKEAVNRGRARAFIRKPATAGEMREALRSVIRPS